MVQFKHSPLNLKKGSARVVQDKERDTRHDGKIRLI